MGDLFAHFVDGTAGLSYLHIACALICFATSVALPAQRTPLIVCGLFYLFGIYIEYFILPHPDTFSDIYPLEQHRNYFATFAIFDAVWLMALLMLGRYIACYVQLLFIVLDVLQMYSRGSIVFQMSDQFMIVLNVIFVAVLIYDDLITWKFRELRHRMDSHFR